MSVTAPEAVDDALAAVEAQPEATPAQQAMLVALAFAAAAEANTERVIRAWLAGRISRVDACYTSGNLILSAIAKATLAGEHFAEVEWQHRVSPKVIPGREHERLVRAFDTITREHERTRAADLLQALAEPGKVPGGTSDQVIMRSTRVAHAEVLKAGRVGYGEAVAQAVGDDPEFVWRFETSATPCGRCVALAAKTFQSFEQAPKDGAHPGCRCEIQAAYREE